MGTEPDDPVTPAGRLFLRPEMDTIIHFSINFEKPIDVDSIKANLKTSVLINHSRFCSLLVRDHHGREHWRKTQVNLDHHFLIVTSDVGVNEYLADLSVSTPLSTDKPLWEIHVLHDQRCLALRLHHALGDGISLMSMFLANCRRVGEPDVLPWIPSEQRKKREGNWLWEYLKLIWFSLVFVLELVLRTLWVCDPKTAITGGAGVELWPRKLATATFSLVDMKLVKEAVANAVILCPKFVSNSTIYYMFVSLYNYPIPSGDVLIPYIRTALISFYGLGRLRVCFLQTINDVLFGVVSSGLSRYLDTRSPNAMQEGLRLTGLAMVNLRKQPGLQKVSESMKKDSGWLWGNKFGMILLPVYYHKSVQDPLLYLKRAKLMIDRKKNSVESHFSYQMGDLVMSLFGPKVACWMNYRIMCNTTFTISNVIGPRDEIEYAGNPITSMRANSSSLPHALTMHMVSYAGKAELQMLVAKDIIPDPEFLAKCFEEALMEMKRAATMIPAKVKI